MKKTNVLVVCGCVMGMATSSACTYEAHLALDPLPTTTPTCDDVDSLGTSTLASVEGLPTASITSARIKPLWRGNADGFIQSMTIRDFNRDGTMDMAFASCPRRMVDFWGNCSLRVMYGAGDATSKRITTLPRGCLRDYRDLRAGDFDGDGVVDLAALTGPDDVAISYWHGNGDGTFTGPDEVLLPKFDEYAYTADVYLPNFFTPNGFMVPGDFRGDKRNEIYLGVAVTESSMVLSAPNERIIAGDLDGDAKDDVIRISVFSDGAPLALTASTSGEIRDVHYCLSKHSCDYRATSGLIAHIDDDQHQDLVLLVKYGGFRYGVFHGNGAGGLDDPQWSNATAEFGPDLNGDGEADLTDIGALVDWHAGDFDGDGRTDLVLATYDDNGSKASSKLTISLGDGLGHFEPRRSLDTDSAVIAIGDFDDDSVMDFVLSEDWDLVVVSGRDIVAATDP